MGLLKRNSESTISKLLNMWKSRIKRDLTGACLVTQGKDRPCSRKRSGSLWSCSTWEGVCSISRELPERTVVFWQHETVSSGYFADVKCLWKAPGLFVQLWVCEPAVRYLLSACTAAFIHIGFTIWIFMLKTDNSSFLMFSSYRSWYLHASLTDQKLVLHTQDWNKCSSLAK